MHRPPRFVPARLRAAWVVLTLVGWPAIGIAGPDDLWMVQTRACPQLLGVDPWPELTALRLVDGRWPVRSDPEDLLTADRPVILLVHGSYITATQAATECRQIRDGLRAAGALPPGTLVVEFDWPSQVTDANPVRDGNEKGRRAHLAGYHLARFLQEFPPGSRVSLVGHSHGGLVVLAALHLLGGGTLSDGESATRLPEPGLDARLRASLIAPAVDRHWLDPGERLECALTVADGIFCLFNRLDPVLPVHPLGRYSDHRRALGKTGMSPHELGLLGARMARYRQRDITRELGARHTFTGSVARPTIARSLLPYFWTRTGPRDGSGATRRVPRPGQSGYRDGGRGREEPAPAPGPLPGREEKGSWHRPRPLNLEPLPPRGSAPWFLG